MPVIEGGFNLEGGNSARIAVQTQTALTIFENTVITQCDQYARALGVYGDVVLGRDLEARFGSFSLPKHLFSSRKNGCTWNPKGGVRLNVESFPTCPIEYNGTQCPDAWYGDCFERLFSPGNGVTDMAGTPEGQTVLAATMRRVYQGLGNSFFSLYNFANHPLITDANTGGFYRAGIEEWTDYVDQMTSGSCGGLITQLDELANAGTTGFTVKIADADISAAGKFTGSFETLIQTLIDSASPELREAIASGVTMANGQILYPVVMASASIFEAYKGYLKATYGTNELAYRYMIEGVDGVTPLTRNILMWDSLPVIRWDANSEFDSIVGTQSHRLAIVMPGVFGVLHNVDNLNEWEGMGLIMERSPLLRDKGRVDMFTSLRWGAGIADPKYVAMASLIRHPLA